MADQATSVGFGDGTCLGDFGEGGGAGWGKGFSAGLRVSCLGLKV